MTYNVGDKLRVISPWHAGAPTVGTIGTVKRLDQLMVTLDIGGTEFHFKVGDMSSYFTRAHTYQPGDKVRATQDGWGSILTGPIYKGDVGEFLHMDEEAYVLKFGGGAVRTSNTALFELYTVSVTGPLACVRCNEFNDHAQPNLPDGRYACWVCRKYHSYSLTTK